MYDANRVDLYLLSWRQQEEGKRKQKPQEPTKRLVIFSLSPSLSLSLTRMRARAIKGAADECIKCVQFSCISCR
jgi:hypothetical protein